MNSLGLMPASTSARHEGHECAECVGCDSQGLRGVWSPGARQSRSGSKRNVGTGLGEVSAYLMSSRNISG